jgi:hypothetical protein
VRRYRIAVDFRAADDELARAVARVVESKLAGGQVRLEEFELELLAEAAPAWKLVEVLERSSR